MMVRTGEQGPKGISCLMVDADTPNMSLDAKEQKVSKHCTAMFVINCLY